MDLLAEFPFWLRTSHWINAFFLGLLARAGIQILAALPKLYWKEGAVPGTEWLKFTRKQLPTDRVWISLEEEIEVPTLIAQPGGNNLGLGRHWHFFSALFWILNGAVYVVLLFATDEWRRLLPTSWSVFPDALRTAWEPGLRLIGFANGLSRCVCSSIAAVSSLRYLRPCCTSCAASVDLPEPLEPMSARPLPRSSASAAPWTSRP